MLRPTDWVQGWEIVGEVKEQFPETETLFERHGIRAACYDCTIEQAARRAGASLDDLLLELNELISKEARVKF